MSQRIGGPLVHLPVPVTFNLSQLDRGFRMFVRWSDAKIVWYVSRYLPELRKRGVAAKPFRLGFWT